MKSSKARKDVGEKRPHLKLRTLDWSVPIIMCSGQMAVVTPKAVSDQLSRKVQVKAFTEENRLVRVDRFLTTLGDVEVKPNHELNPGSYTINIPNNTCKIVLQIPHPKAAFYKWATAMNVEKEILYMTSPFLEGIRRSGMVGSVCDHS